MKKIIYIGNNLAKKSKYHSAMETLSSLLLTEGFTVIKSSSKQNKIIRLAQMCLTLIKYRKSTDYVVIDTFSTLNFWYAFITSQLAKFLKLRYIPILHGGNLPIRLDKTPFFSTLIFDNAYLNVSPSKYLEFEFKKRNFKTSYIPNSINLKNYTFKLRENIQPKLLWVRAFDVIYNPLLAIKVLCKLKEKYPKATLCMVGPDKDGSLMEAKQLAKKLNIINSITFTGVLKKEDWQQLSKKYDIFINTTNVDNMPVSIIEAMALGFPVISTNVGGLPYLIEDNVDGILIEPKNEKYIVKAIEKLIKNPKIAIKLSMNARKKASTFDSENIKKEWLKILRNVL
ncbi:glycosyl transferase family 1 [Lutibacter profundi]|uniref:Glycosyl transferase family 1 n=1 Tax=Lutibacter profundi TaxID=1622118 RepID=A0A109RP87_9FLAO|nr:glycosyltransferase [Lutibacter profundi]AMC10137.1 glycosyl transferase family 1 [Lutibacter profundi]